MIFAKKGVYDSLRVWSKDKYTYMPLLYVSISKFILLCHSLKIQLHRNVNMLQLLQKDYRVSTKIASFARQKTLMCRRAKCWGTAPITPYPPLATHLDATRQEE